MERYTTSYLQLIKPGITLSNTVTAIAGYLFAAGLNGFNGRILLLTSIGVAMVIASACVANNIIDRNIDTKMKRTRERAVASGQINIQSATLLSAILGIGGLLMLGAGVNALTALLGVLAYVWYVVIYTFSKRKTPFSTIIGAVCGALPPVAGYTAATNQLDLTAVILFMLLFVWQLPHFYAIAIFRQSDYQKAGIPVWSIKYGKVSTRRQIMFWLAVFALLVAFVTMSGEASVYFAFVMVPAALYWAVDGAVSFRRLDEIAWARRTFGTSLFILILLAFSLSLSGFLASA